MEKLPSADINTTVDMKTLEEFSHLLQSQPKNLYTESWHRHQIQKVPPQIRRSQHLYDPVMVSLGPYHHGKPELRRAEEFKLLCLDWRSGGDEKKKAFFYSKILDEIQSIRDSYAEATIVAKYDDKSLALMMLLDASIIIDFIHNFNYNWSTFLTWQRCLGAGSGLLMVRDMMLMENQIPFRVLKLLISLQYEAIEAKLFLPRYFTSYMVGVEVKQSSEEIDDDPPIHFLEAFWRVIVKKRCQNIINSNSNGFAVSFSSFGEEMKKNPSFISFYTHRSVMDLKAKGIRVSPNSTRSLTDITFKPNACFSQLELPFQDISDLTPVVVANIIAFEVSPSGGRTGLVVLSYAILMKSLIQSAEDVKELQERGIILNRLANLERVVEVFKEIDTFGLHDQDVFKDVKREIEEHCNSRARTWIAELIYTRFRTPWTAVAFFAAALLLGLTFLQTLFTIRR